MPKVECPKCSEIKYIKVPTVITRTIKVDSSNNVVSEEIAEETKDPEPVVTQKSLINKVKNALTPQTTIPQTTVVPEASVGEVETTTTIPKVHAKANKEKQANCKTVGLNSDFKNSVFMDFKLF